MEKAHDTEYWNFFKTESISASRAHEYIEFQRLPVGTTPELPSDLVSLIHRSMHEVYGSYHLQGGLPDPGSIQMMYRLYHRYLKSMSTLGGLNIPPPEDFDWFDVDTWIQDEIKDTWQNRPTGLPNPLPSNPSLSDLKSLFASVLNSALWLAEVAIKVTTVVVAALARGVTAPIRYLLYLLEKSLCDFYLEIRMALALLGFLHFEPQQLVGPGVPPV